MPQPLRKSFQKSAASGGKPRRFTFSLSGVAVAALGMVLAAAVGWAFFMGFMVGRGQNPEKSVEQMTGMLGDEQAQPAAPVPPTAPAAPGAQSAPTAQPERAEQPEQAGSAAEVPASPADASQNAARAQQSPQAAPQDGSAFPFSRPQGAGLAAWGISPATPAPGAAAAPSSPPQGQRADPRQAQRAPAAQPKAAQAEPLFDYSFQVAAFKDKADADKLRARLESKGLRSRQQKSGKVLLVLVNLRGTELDAANLREELQRMKLGKPILASKKAVSGKSRKTGR
ncbi:MAG: SPOR domain-containing protein [Desulfovibrio sp.]|uniref:SPOR domain-containing protein n=1 Tax=Desulfovibrio sp. TaxID=885 RepID=UPI0025C6DD86|nr:SPOR domain-containing protein [Desulfovibrio sp.]MBS6829290.1 SPOR domain-containing protein [Desulfovibrio sp.]